MNYNDAWSFLEQLQFFKIKLGLDSMNQFLDSLGHPQNQFPCIHIGGTNGKGSVGATLLSILQEAGYNTGMYTSPHLSSVQERFRINDEFIPEEDFTVQAGRIIDILRGRQITYFEFTTALALLWFAEKNVDIALLEVGLGGRLDATNIVIPLVSVITNVSMDHEQYLGDTLSQVASEKAGIIKPTIPVISGTSFDDSLTVLSSVAEQQNSPLFLLDRDFKGIPAPRGTRQWTYEGIRAMGFNDKNSLKNLPLAMKGNYQVDNAAVALAALEIINPSFPVTEKNIRDGLKKVTWPGRLEEFWRDQSGAIFLTDLEKQGNTTSHFLLDGAHNPAGAAALEHALEHDFSYTRLILIWASMADKDMENTLLRIAPLADEIIFTRPEEERSAAPEMLYTLLPDNLKQKASCLSSVQGTINTAIEKATHHDMICIAGSLYLVGKARKILCGELVGNI